MSLQGTPLRMKRPALARSAAVLALVLIYLAVCAGAAHAQAEVEVNEEGCGCHSEESATWLASPHGQASLESAGAAGPTCEGCHGAYVRGHPHDGLMELTMDSSMCTDCHQETYEEWQGTQHAEAGVQCIGCHLSHSQALRLTGSELCASCHRDSPSDSFHVSHRASDVACTNCHVAPDAGSESGMVQVAGMAAAPTHDFTTVSAANCVDCHSTQIGDVESLGERDATITELMTVANRAPVPDNELAAAKRQNRTHATVTFVSLGLGIGVGGVAGMILVLFVGYVSQRKS